MTNEKTDPMTEAILNRIRKRVDEATQAKVNARHRELRAMSHRELLAEKKRLMTHARSLGLDPDELLRV